jgi:ribosome-binding protein aMBF1 (putative translation factor)
VPPETTEQEPSLADRIRADRIARAMTWQRYAQWMGVKLSTIYKISRGDTNLPHELTLDKIKKKLAEPVAAAEPAAESGGSGEVVPGG